MGPLCRTLFEAAEAIPEERWAGGVLSISVAFAVDTKSPGLSCEITLEESPGKGPGGGGGATSMEEPSSGSPGPLRPDMPIRWTR